MRGDGGDHIPVPPRLLVIPPIPRVDPPPGLRHWPACVMDAFLPNAHNLLYHPRSVCNGLSSAEDRNTPQN